MASSGGVPPIDISSRLWPGAIQAQITTVDTGGYLTSSTLYVVTNCTNEGISGSGNITGNPISNSNPTGQQLTQNYGFNSSNNLQVQFTYDLSQARMPERYRSRMAPRLRLRIHPSTRPPSPPTI